MKQALKLSHFKHISMCTSKSGVSKDSKNLTLNTRNLIG